jgi:hypothetical protein
MSPLRLALLAAGVALPACGADPAPPLAAAPDQVAVAPSAAPATACEALAGPLRTLRRLAAVVGPGRSMPLRPLHPALFEATLSADAARARAAPPDPGAPARLAAGTAARLEAIAIAARALSARPPGDAEPAREALLQEMERGELLVLQGGERCAGAPAGQHSAAALESTAGRLPGSAVQRAVRAGAGAFRACHEAALRRDRTRSGAVRVAFVIGPDGAVTEAADVDLSPPDALAFGLPATAAPLRDAAVSACVLSAFRALTFPRPAGGSFSAVTAIELGASP